VSTDAAQDSSLIRMFNFLLILGQMGIKVTFVADDLQKTANRRL